MIAGVTVAGDATRDVPGGVDTYPPSVHGVRVFRALSNQSTEDLRVGNEKVAIAHPIIEGSSTSGACREVYRFIRASPPWA